MNPSRFKILSTSFDKNIRIECDKSKVLLEKCLQEQFNDTFVCKYYENMFEDCKKKFIVNFYKKHPKLKNQSIEILM